MAAVWCGGSDYQQSAIYHRAPSFHLDILDNGAESIIYRSAGAHAESVITLFQFGSRGTELDGQMPFC
ncbi:hypothetical protein GPX89_01985 [Nocardia sp. ET3-3]|uniref:Uncharacterized protein n=1 Tax=Nocardia terrae TaxID=2675851 RepID=A0A7K1UNW2_9NOCA|nr:hypothetical protein [Nocardia terrae]MVU76011.1 hypothetical protein [Nocardia terrae]